MNLDAGLKKLNELSQKSTLAHALLAELFDDGCYTELERFVKNGENDCALATAYGNVNGALCFAFSQNSGASGAISTVSAKKIEKVYLTAKKVGAPVIGVYNCDGADINEGIDALEAYASLMARIAEISGVVPQISVITGACIGSSAVMAAMADVVIMTKDAEMYVTSGNILKDSTVGTAELCAKNGTVSVVTENTAGAFAKTAEIISFLPQNNLGLPYVSEYIPSESVANGTEAYSVINSVVDGNSFCEMYKDFATDIVTGFARVNGNSVAVVATNTDGKSISADGAKKSARFIRFADAFSLPVISFVDADGILGDKDDEIAGGVKYSAQLTQALAEATTAKITVITGSAVGTAYMAFASRATGADSVFAWPTAYISALKPAAAVEFLKREELSGDITRKELEQQYIDTTASAFVAAEKGFVEDIITPLETAPKIALALDCLASKRVSTISKKHSNIQL